MGQANAVKSLIVASTAAIVVAGDIYGVLFKINERGEANAVFFGFLVALILPTVLFALGIRQARSIYVYGSLLFGLTAAAWWLPVLVSRAPWLSTSRRVAGDPGHVDDRSVAGSAGDAVFLIARWPRSADVDDDYRNVVACAAVGGTSDELDGCSLRPGDSAKNVSDLVVVHLVK